MSSTCSRPMERRISSGRTPPFLRSSSESCECVVDAGCMTSDFASPTLARIEKISPLSASAKHRALSEPPLTPKTTIPPAPFGRYFFASSGCVREGYLTQATFGCFSRYFATASAFSLWRAMRSGSDSTPWRKIHAASGASVGPWLRIPTVRRRIENAMGLSGSGRSCANLRPW